MKVCFKCKIEKELTEFSKRKSNKDGYKGTCIICIAKYNAEYHIYRYQKNKEEFKYKTKEWYKNNKERTAEYKKEYARKNKEAIKSYRKEYYKNNKEKLKEKAKEWRKNNKEKRNETEKKWQLNRRKTDHLFNMICNLRTRTSVAFKRKSWKKNGGTEKMLGCTFETAHAHIERQFTKGMSWDNHGEWHIDHIIPLAAANTEEELIKLCHYRNLQPLWAKDNLSKSAKIPNVQIQFKL